MNNRSVIVTSLLIPCVHTKTFFSNSPIFFFLSCLFLSPKGTWSMASVSLVEGIQTMSSKNLQSYLHTIQSIKWTKLWWWYMQSPTNNMTARYLRQTTTNAHRIVWYITLVDWTFASALQYFSLWTFYSRRLVVCNPRFLSCGVHMPHGLEWG